MRNDNLRVLFVSSHAQIGGSERYLELVLDHLPREWIAAVVCLEEGPFRKRLEAKRYRVETIDSRGKIRVPQAAIQLRSLLRKYKPNLVHANGGKAALTTGLAITRTGIPSIWLKHDYYCDGWPAELTARLNTRVVGVGQGVVQTFRSKIRSRVFVVYSGIPRLKVDSVTGRRRLSSLLGASTENSELLVLTGRLCPVKGQLEFVQTVASMLLERRPNLRIGIIGGSDPADPSYAKRVEQQVTTNDVDGRLRLLGHQDDVLPLIAAADGMLVTSGPYTRHLPGEGFPYVVLEAMALGTPVIAYSAGGIPELLQESGVLVPFNNHSKLLESIDMLLDNSDLRKKLQDRGQSRARLFSIERLLDGLTQHYFDVAVR